VVNKVRLIFRSDCCLDRLNGAQIQGSNDGNNWNTIYTIAQNSNGTTNWQDFNFSNSTSYQRVRFQSSGSGYGELWELEFYNNNTKLSGSSFGTGGAWDNNTALYGYQNALDGNPGSFWHGASSGAGTTAGLILSECSTGPNCNFSLSASNSNGNPSCGGSINLNSSCSGADCGGVTYSWSGPNFSSSAQNPTNVTVPSSNGTHTYTVTGSKSGCSNQSASTSVSVSGCGGLNQCIESENSGGNGAITSDPNASNGQTRGEENNANHYVDYQVTGVPSAGTYYAKLRYYSSSAPTVSVSVNGSGGTSYNIPHSGSWNIVWTEYTFAVSLNAGNNTIRIQGTGGGSCRQDRVCFSNNARLAVEGAKTDLVDENRDEITLYPNPTDGRVVMRYYLERGQKASLRFVNVAGAVLTQKSLTGEGRWATEATDLSAQPNGSYLLYFEADKRKITKKFVIAK
jgi:hypothetical protein